MTTNGIRRFFKTRPFLAVCGLLVCVAGLAIFFRWEQIDEVTEQLEAKAKEAMTLEKNLGHAAGLAEHLKALSEAEAEVPRHLGIASQMANNFSYLYGLEVATGVKFVDLQSLSGVSKVAKSSYVRIPFSITAQGTSNQVLDLLSRIEEGERYCRLSVATLTATKSDPPDDTLLLNINFDMLGSP
jgi:hypothetical protein